MRSAVPLWARGIVCAAALLRGAAAAAQSCSEPPPKTVFVGTPRTGSMGVPTNVAFLYQIPARLGAPAPGMFYLRSGSGMIPLDEERVLGNFLQLRPRQALAPHTSHQLSGTWGVSDTVDDALLFWTGDGPYHGPPAPPDVLLQPYRVRPDVAGAKCASPRHGTCIAFGAPDAVVEYTLLDGADTERAPALALGSVLLDLTGLDPAEHARCVRLRARGPDGSFSEPRELCADDVPVWQADRAEVRCEPGGLTWEDMPEVPEIVHDALSAGADAGEPARAASAAHGCSVLPPQGARTGWLLGLACAASLYRRRRAATRQHRFSERDAC